MAVGSIQEPRRTNIIIQTLSLFSSKILLRSPSNPRPKHRTSHRHIQLIKRVHDGLDPGIVYVKEEILGCFFGCGAGGIECCGCRGAGKGRGGAGPARYC
jgi:hypothetical protein